MPFPFGAYNPTHLSDKDLAKLTPEEIKKIASDEITRIMKDMSKEDLQRWLDLYTKTLDDMNRIDPTSDKSQTVAYISKAQITAELSTRAVKVIDG
jgi:hypothetical protein